jgi:hypothetical protein
MNEPFSQRAARLSAEARRQGLALTRIPGDDWQLFPLEASQGWKLLRHQRQRLPDGRVVAMRMTLDEVEAFLGAGTS